MLETLAPLIASSIKLLESGLKLALWDGWATFPAQDRLAWLTKLLGLGGDSITRIGDILKVVSPAPLRPDQAVHLWAINVACFGEALSHHWGGNERMAGTTNRWGKWFAPAWVSERTQEVESALKFALSELERTKSFMLPEQRTWEYPTASRMYQALWRSFVTHEVPLLSFDKDGDVQAFERSFSRAFREALARGGNAEIRTALSDGQPRGESLKQLLVTDMASWRYKHVFSGVDTSEGIPEMPLEKVYTEPTAECQVDGKKRVGPVLSLLRELLTKYRVVCLSADFGMGKSLTARTLAWQWAEAYLDPHCNIPSVERVLPIHVRCANNTSLRDGIDGIVRRSLKRSAETIGISVPLSDIALSPPSAEQRAVVLFDGLDELTMSTEQVKDLFSELLDNATDRQRFVIFSRPEVLSQPEIEYGVQIPHVKLHAFSAMQVDEWLWAWPKGEAPTRAVLEANGLGELTKVPILLFMLALTWNIHSSQDKIPCTQIYETFFETLAAGKYERGGETHPQIRTAAEQARDALLELGELHGYKGADQKAAVAAIRWLMDRMAWEVLRREFIGDTLSRRHVSNLLADELGLPEATLDQVRIGLLLGMQAQGGGQQFFFGHRSFLEFAAAKYWERVLMRLCTAERHDYAELEEKIAGAPLLCRGSRIFSFLCDLLGTWSKSDCQRLILWATTALNDETVCANRSERRQTFRNDQRLLIRHAALSIGCRLARRLGRRLVIGDAAVLTAINAWWLIARKRAAVLDVPGFATDSQAFLGGFIGPNSNLQGVGLKGAYLESAILRGANLCNANLRKTNLKCANLAGADLRRATLRGANLRGANLSGANLDGASLRSANLSKSNLRGASLLGASLTGANMEQVTYDQATQWPSGFAVPTDALFAAEPDMPPKEKSLNTMGGNSLITGSEVRTEFDRW
jgi:uncharacterized protein YjbI with pentapeptide repeats